MKVDVELEPFTPLLRPTYADAHAGAISEVRMEGYEFGHTYVWQGPDLDGDLDAMERHVDDLFARSAVRPPLDADVEREHAYDLSVRLETQLGGMLDQLKDVVTKLNLSHDENGDEKSRDIMKIVNAHHQSLAYLSAQASKIEAEVVKLERANEAERRAQAV